MRNAQGGRQSATAAVIPSLLCPSDPVTGNPVQVGNHYFGITSYGGNGGTRSYHPDQASVDGVFHSTGPGSRPRTGQRPVRLEEILDGSSHTILFGERRHDDPNLESFVAASWTESMQYLGRWAALGGQKRIADVTMSGFVAINYRLPFDYDQRQRYEPGLTSSRQFQLLEDRRRCAYGSGHVGGANFVFADSSGRFLASNTELSVLQRMCTRSRDAHLRHAPEPIVTLSATGLAPANNQNSHSN
jgi:hypothetical protein